MYFKVVFQRGKNGYGDDGKLKSVIAKINTVFLVSRLYNNNVYNFYKFKWSLTIIVILHI